MADRSGGVVTNRIRARQVRPPYQKQRHDAYGFLSKMSSGSFLEEKDIPGASLCGRKPSELKNEELKFWLRCRGDPGKGLKTKAELVKRYDIGRCYYCYSTSQLEDFFEVNIYPIPLSG